jgi:hypothetical protein
MTKEARSPNDEETGLSFRAKSRMERLGKPRHGREGPRLSEREVSESNPVVMPIGNAAGLLDSASLRSGSPSVEFIIPSDFVILFLRFGASHSFEYANYGRIFPDRNATS